MVNLQLGMLCTISTKLGDLFLYIVIGITLLAIHNISLYHNGWCSPDILGQTRLSNIHW